VSTAAWILLGWLATVGVTLWVWYRLNRFNQKGPRQYGMPRGKVPRNEREAHWVLHSLPTRPSPLDQLPAYRRRRKLRGKPGGQP
jgi:hypothetical protein